MNIYNQNQLNLMSNRGSMMSSTATSGMVGWPTAVAGGGGGAPAPLPSGGEKETVSDEFPAGLRVLVVDDDPTCLAVLEKMLIKCKYEVTLCTRADVALTLLRENKNGFDIVLSDVHMPDMDGFKLLEQIGLEMDLPVIMMSADDAQHVVMKGVTHGAVDYLIKPVRIEPLRNIWQHVIRKLKSEGKDVEQSGSVEEGNNQPKHSEEADYSSSANEGSWRSSRKRKDDEEEGGDERDDTSTLKKPRVVWSVELHQQFVAAVNQLGIDKAVPKRILELMNVPGLTRENVASHLQKYRDIMTQKNVLYLTESDCMQKYRLYLKRLSGVPPHQNNNLGGNAFINPPEPPFLTLPPIGGMEMQTIAATAQFPAQSLTTLQTAGLGRSAVKPRMPVPPPVDQRSLFNLENQKLRFSEGPTQLNSSKQMSLLHGVPTNMEPKQLANLHNSSPAVGSMNMPVNFHGGQGSQSSSFLMQMSQSQSRTQMINETSGSHVPTLPSSMGQSVVPNVIAGGLLGRNGLAVNGRGAGYNPVPQSSPLMNFPLNSSTEISGTSFPLGTSPGMSSLASKGTFQDEVSSGLKGPIGLMPSYDIFADLNQHKSHDWQLPNLGMTFNGSQSSSLQSNFVPSDFSPSQGTEGVGKNMFSAGNATNLVNPPSVGQNLNIYFDNSVRIKSEILPETDGFFPDQFSQDHLMSAILKQQGGVFPNENDYEYDGYTLDNIPV